MSTSSQDISLGNVIINFRDSYYNWQSQTEESILNVQITVDRTEFVKLEDHFF